MTGEYYILGILLLQNNSGVRVVQRNMEQAGKQSTSRRSWMATNNSWDGCQYSRCGGRSDSGLSKNHEFSTPLTEEVDAQGETWFKHENSLTERRRRMHLERELEAALRFEHGDEDDGGP